MHLTRYSDYSVRVLLHLSTYSDRLACIAEIAQAYGISQSHLMKVVQDLGQSGYIETVRGRHGGIRLRKPAAEINLGALIRHTEKHVEVVDCGSCLIAPACQASNVFAQAMRAFLAVLDQYTLADMMVRRHHLHRLFSGTQATPTAVRQ